MKKKYLILITLLFSFFTSFSQSEFDTITVMQYNLMYFNTADPPGPCVPISALDRSKYISTIIGYVVPDVFGVNEMNDDANTPDILLNNALNANGRTNYARAAFVSEPGDQINNMLFFNKEKLRLVSQAVIGCSPRQANIYTLRHLYRQPNGDSATLHFIVVHLKSSSGSSDKAVRATCATNIVSYLQSYHETTKNNLFVMGDFNFYNTNELAYTAFTTSLNSRVNLFDPLYGTAELNTLTGSYRYIGDNGLFKGAMTSSVPLASHHTQSPGSSQPCQASGGMDDRFDYIIFNKSVFNDSAYVNFVPGTYKALGNDGNHLDLAINNGTNTIVPPLVLDALANNSDHLPVTAKVRVPISNATFLNPSITFTGFNVTVDGNSINLLNTFSTNSRGNVYFELSGNAASLAGSNLTPLVDGSVTITGKVAGVLGYNRAEKTVVVNIISKPVDPNLVAGKFTTNVSQITITSPTRTISGVYKFAPNGNGITITGISSSISGASFSGVFVGTQTISGNNISFYINNTLVVTSLQYFSSEGLQVSVNGKCLVIKTESSQLLEAAIFDLSGRIIWSEKVAGGETRCTLPNLPQGVFILKVQGITGEPKFIQKLVVD